MEHEYMIPFDKTLCEMLVSAERYALGRQTYIVGDTVEFISAHLKHFDTMSLQVIEEDIRRAHSYGSESIDKPYWMSLLNDIAEEICRRNS